MRSEQLGNTHPRLLRKTALGDTVAAIPKRRRTAETPSAKDVASLKGAPTAKETTASPKGRKDSRKAAKQVPEAATDRERRPKTAETKGQSKTPDKIGRSRFVGPAHLDEARKAQIETALEKRGIGDAIGRQIFIGALEYQISAFGDQLQRRGETAPPPGPARESQRLARPASKPTTSPRQNPTADPPDEATHPTFADIVEQTSRLSKLLRDIGGTSKIGLIAALTAQDRLGRSYNEHYLRELACEIERLEMACTFVEDMEGITESGAPEIGEIREPDADEMGVIQETETPVEDPSSSRGLVKKLASIFAECFEQEATGEAGGQFQTLLAVLEEETGFVIGHDTAFLEDVLRD